MILNLISMSSVTSTRRRAHWSSRRVIVGIEIEQRGCDGVRLNSRQGPSASYWSAVPGSRGPHQCSQSPATPILQRLPFSSDSHSPATPILQRLPFSSDCHSPATTILPAPAILQRLPFSSHCHSPAPTILQRPIFSSACHSPAPTILQRLQPIRS